MRRKPKLDAVHRQIMGRRIRETGGLVIRTQLSPYSELGSFMKTILLYGGSGTYLGTSEYEWKCPVEGDTHKFILFVAKEEGESRPDIAAEELRKFGLVNCEVGEGRPISVESLNEPRMQEFQKHYEGAFTEGASIVWYP